VVAVGLSHAAARGDEDQAQVLARAAARRRAAAYAARGRAAHA
jgi:hypothetical protein